MEDRDPINDFRQALDRLSDLERSVASQEDQRQVLDAITQLRIAVIRAYGGRKPRNQSGSGATTVLLTYMRERLGQWIYADELAAVSGVDAWTRRLRQLRVESGYDIEEHDGQYRLRALAPDPERRERWQTVTRLRDMKVGAEERAHALFQHLVNQVITVDELNRVAHNKDGARLARSLRSSDGWPIETVGDAPDLGSGEFRLASLDDRDRLPSTQKLFSEDVRASVFARDGYRCWDCHTDRRDAAGAGEAPFFLLVRHVDCKPSKLQSLPAGQLAEPRYLATVCNRCYRDG
jgi:hypothetical protein